MPSPTTTAPTGFSPARASRLPVLLVLASAVLWGTYGSFVTVIEGMGMAGSTLVALRFAATALPVLGIVLARDPGMLRVRPRDLWLFVANGLASIVFFTWCYTAAIVETKIATAAALLYTAPAIVLVLSAFVFRERMTVRKAVCVAIAVAGCALVSGLGAASGASLTPKGLLLGLGAGLGYALYSIFSTLIMRRGYAAYTNVVYTFGIATLVYLGISAAQGTLGQVVELPGATALALACGLVTGAAAYVLYTRGLAGMEPSRAAQVACVEPVTAAVLGTALFGQVLGATELLGMALVVGSVVAMNAGGGNRTGGGKGDDTEKPVSATTGPDGEAPDQGRNA